MNPIIYVGATLGVLSLIFIIAYLCIKDKKEAFGFDRNMKDGDITKRLLKYGGENKALFCCGASGRLCSGGFAGAVGFPNLSRSASVPLMIKGLRMPRTITSITILPITIATTSITLFFPLKIKSACNTKPHAPKNASSVLLPHKISALSEIRKREPTFLPRVKKDIGTSNSAKI